LTKRFKINIRTLKSFNLKAGGAITFLMILLLALIVRLIVYTGLVDWDFLNYAYSAHNASLGNIHVEPDLGAVSFRPALYLPVGLFYALFGPSEFTTILYPLLASLLGIACIYGIGRIQANESAGIIAALIWAGLPLNVFLSTLFGPDAILATFTITAVFFLLLGNKSTTRRAYWFYFLAFCFEAIAILVKPSAIITLTFFGLFFLLKIWQRYKGPLEKWFRSHTVPVRSSTVGITATLLFGLLFAYFQRQSSPFLLSLFRGATDLSNLLVLGKIQEYFPDLERFANTDLFLVASPVFIMGLAALLSKRIAGSALPILWMASQFLYYEWGSLSPNIFVYVPFLARTSDRNVLFIMAPFCVLAGIFLSQAIKTNQARVLAVIALLTVAPMAWWAKQSMFTGFPITLLSFTVMASVIGILVAPYIVSQNFRGNKPLVMGSVLMLTLLAFLYPTPPLHISSEYWQQQIAYRQAIRQAAQLLLTAPDYPILSLDNRNASELDFFSNFQLGYREQAVNGAHSDERIQVISDPKAWSNSAYIYLRDEINQIRPVPSTWWKVAEFDVGAEKPLLIYRVLSSEDAHQEIESAKRAVAQKPIRATLERLLSAGVNAGDASIAVDAWIQLKDLAPGAYPLDVIAPLLIEHFSGATKISGTNLLAGGFDQTLGNYQIDPPLQDSVHLENAKGEDILSVRLTKDLGGQFGVYKQITLEPSTAYIFLIDVESTVGVDLLRVMQGSIADSHSFSNVYGEWSEIAVVFITPHWNAPQNVRLDLFTVNKQGLILIKDPRLYVLEN